MECYVTVHQGEIGVVERCGKFHEFLNPGLSCICPPFDRLVGNINMRIQNMTIQMEGKTRDNVFVNLLLAVQYQAVPTDLYDTYYKLSNPIAHIDPYIRSVVRSTVPMMTLDELFTSKDSIGNAVRESAEKEFFDIGYHIVQVLVSDILPDEVVKQAINEINSQERMRTANKATADANKLSMVSAAEAEAQTKYLSGVGLAKSRQAVMDGMRESINSMVDTGDVFDSERASRMILLTQYFEGLKSIAETSETVTMFMSHRPSQISQISSEISHYINPPDMIFRLTPQQRSRKEES